MTDLVERLEAWARRESASGIAEDAINEIERLRAEVEQQRLELGITGDACGALDSEAKQLRAEVLEQCRLNGMGGSREAKLIAENAQLRARVAELEAALSWYANALEHSKSMSYRVYAQDGGKRARLALMKEGSQ